MVESGWMRCFPHTLMPQAVRIRKGLAGVRVVAEPGLPVRPWLGGFLPQPWLRSRSAFFSSPGIMPLSVRLLTVTAITSVTVYSIRTPKGILCER